MHLNDLQEETKTSINSNVMLNAPPGTGKTETIAQRIIHILNTTPCHPRRILCITHTNEATENTRRRLMQSLPKSVVSSIYISTVHSFAFDLLQQLPPYSSRDWALIEDKEIAHLYHQTAFKIFRIIDRSVADDPIEAFNSRLDALKEEVLQRRDFYHKNNPTKPLKKLQENLDKIENYKEYAREYKDYRDKLKSKKLLLHDHVITELVRILNTDPSLCIKIQSSFDHVMVDECQDIGEGQVALLKAVLADSTILMLAGDENQSIYSFNGTVKNPYARLQSEMEKRHFLRFSFSENYRSTPTIRAISDFVINKTKAEICESERPVVRVYPTTDQEIVGTAREILRLVRDEGVPTKDIAVLAPFNSTLEVLSRALDYYGIPFRRKGKCDISQLPLTKHFILFLKLVVLESDPSLFMDTSSDDLLFMLLHSTPMFGEATPDPVYIREAWKKHRHGIRQWAAADTSGDPLAALIQRITKCITKCYQLRPSETIAVIYAYFRPQGSRTVYALIEHARSLETRYNTDLIEYVDQLSCISRAEKCTIEAAEEADSSDDKVSLFTCHASKSLGFEHVFVLLCNYKNWHKKWNLFESISNDIQDINDEKRRLFHVVVSRAKSRLYMSYNKSDDACEFIDELLEAKLVTENKMENIEYEDLILATNHQIALGSGCPGIRPSTMSSSLLMDAESCPFQALMKRVDGISLYTFKDNSPRVQGNLIHSILEKFHLHRQKEGSFPDISADPRVASLPEDKRTAFISYVDNRLALWEQEYARGLDIRMEEKIEAHDGGILLKGTMDRTIRVSPDRMIIYDYKTGMVDKKKFKTQAIFYVLLCRLNGYEKTDTVVFEMIGSSPPEKPETIIVSDTDIADVKTRIKKCLDALLQGTKCMKETCEWCQWHLD